MEEICIIIKRCHEQEIIKEYVPREVRIEK